jgi:hypothetical protein
MPESTLATLYNSAPSTSDAALFTSSTGNVVKKLLAVNGTGSAATITVWYIRSGDSESSNSHSNEIAAAFSVPANSVADLLAGEELESEYDELVLETGDSIRGSQGTGSAITLLIAGA